MSTSSSSGFELAGSTTTDDLTYTLTMGYDKAGGITSKIQSLTNHPQFSYTNSYFYEGAELHQLNRIEVTGGTTREYTYNNMGSVTKVAAPGSSSTQYLEKYCWSDEQTLRMAGKDDHPVGHYTYDHTGQRLLKGTLNFAQGGVNGIPGNGKYSMNPYTVYPNAYYNTQFYEQTEEASKHYYMGSQRVASAVISRNATAGATATNPGAETDLQEALECMGLTAGSDFVMSTLLQSVGYEEEVSQAEYEQLHPAVYRDCNDDPACLCGLDAYWTEQLTTIECSDYNIMYWYHPDYLGNTEFVTDFEGNAYQSFWYSPWGETLDQRNSFAATWGALHRFNAQEFDFETGAIYMSARYYRAKDHPGFLSVDPMSAARPWLTPYNFVQNNPVMRTDPTGLLDGDNDDWWINQKTGEVVHAPGETSIENVDVQDKENYVKFATDQQMSSASYNRAPGADASYTKKTWSANEAQKMFKSWGVEKWYSVNTVSLLRITTMETFDQELGGQINIETFLSKDIINQRYEIASPAGRLHFNKTREPKYIGSRSPGSGIYPRLNYYDERVMTLLGRDVHSSMERHSSNSSFTNLITELLPIIFNRIK